MKFTLPKILSTEIEALAKANNEPVEVLLSRMLRTGIITQKNTDDESHLLIVNPKGHKNQVLEVPLKREH